MTNLITRDLLVTWFIKNYKDLTIEMMKADHTVDLDFPNIWHGEGTVWTHTMMVMTWIEAQKDKLKNEDYIVLITSAMLHDTGKPQCLETMPASNDKPIRNSFKGHEGVSSFIVVGVLKDLKTYFPEIYTDEIIEKIIKLVSLHGTFVEESSEMRFLQMKFREADKFGAIRNTDEGLFSQYEPRKFLKKGPGKFKNKLFMLIGLPNSGKSTLREKIVSENPETIVISRDDLLEVFYKEKTNEINTYNVMYKYIHDDKEILNEFDTRFEKFIQDTSKQDIPVIIDMTMLSLSTRRKMISKFSNHKKEAFVVMTDNNTLFNRNIKRYQETKKFISTVVINNMMTSFTYPVLEEGFENINLIIS